MALADKTGQRVPNVTFPTRQNGEWVNVSTDDLFKGKTVVLFALPVHSPQLVLQRIYLVITN